MCGLAGFLDLSYTMRQNELREAVIKMTNTLYHRGPNDSGVWVDPAAGIALGHRRLSVLDLSPEGHQPMHSACGRYVIVFNGEIYNYRTIREELEILGAVLRWRGHSDTEVMLASIRHFGLKQALSRFNGMFAFALWDRDNRTLTLARDRLGEKPLYYGWMGKTFLFGSELKAFRVHPDFTEEINRGALALLIRHNYVPGPHSIYKGIYKLLPGCTLTLEGSKPDQETEIVPYWSARDVAVSGVRNPFSGSDLEAIQCLDNLLRDAVRLRMEADVPLGAFLSGGYDSSTVVALMQVQSLKQVKTFSIGFHEKGYNEANHAKEVAKYLGTEHTEIYVTPEEAVAVIPRLAILYDEPFSDSSQIPTFLVSQLAREYVTVSLSGDGGDELFAGYNRYKWGNSIWGKTRWLPHSLRSGTNRMITSLSPERWNRIFERIQPVLPTRFQTSLFGDKLYKFAKILQADCPDALYCMLVSHWDNPSELVLSGEESPTVITSLSQQATLTNFTHRMMYADLISYLPDDILVKVDRASMGVSLEARVPLLDHRVVEFAWQLPLNIKLRHGKSKWILRQVLQKYLPVKLTDRPKMGFGVPIDTWLRGPLRDWAENLLDEKRICQEGFFHAAPIRQKWTEHLSGKRNWQYHLWDVLMFQAWREHWN